MIVKHSCCDILNAHCYDFVFFAFFEFCLSKSTNEISCLRINAIIRLINYSTNNLFSQFQYQICYSLDDLFNDRIVFIFSKLNLTFV